MKQLILTPHRLPAHNEQQIRHILRTIGKMLKQGDSEERTVKILR